MGWIARGLLFIGGIVASWFVATDADNFHFISFVIAMLLFVLAMVVVTFLPALMQKIRAKRDGKTQGTDGRGPEA